MECATGDAPPPSILTLAWQCERWNTLPDDGNLYAQDYITMYQMTGFLNVYNVIARLKSLKGKAIHSLSDSERKLLKYLMDQGILFNA